jgi:hypothetical protein
MRWRKVERGVYRLEGTDLEIVNHGGDGPNTPRWAGALTPKWEVRQLSPSGRAARGITTAWTMVEAKQKAEARAS